MTDYLGEAMSAYDRRQGYNDIAQTAALISIAQSLVTIASAMQPAPVTEKRPSVVRVGENDFVNLADVSYCEYSVDGRPFVRVYLRGNNDPWRFYDDKMTAFLQAYRAYCGLVGTEGDPAAGNGDRDYLVALLRDVLGDLPADFESVGAAVARRYLARLED